MSFILDALRRAESGPTPAPAVGKPIVTHKVPAAPADLSKRFRLGGIALGLLAACAAAAWWLGRDAPPATAPAMPNPTASVTNAPAPTPAQPPPPRRQPVRALNREVARATPAPSTPPALAPPPARTASTSGSTLPPPGTKGTVTIMPEVSYNQPVSKSPAAPVTAQDTAQVPTPAPGPVPDAPPTTTADAQLPQYENLLRAGRINLPNLKLDMHVYNREPAKRFVFINLRKYREGVALDARTQIEEITPNGAVILHNGQRFLLRPN